MKGQGHRGQRSNLCCFFSVCSPTSPRSLGRSSPNLVGRLRAAPDISSRGLFFKGQGHQGQRSNFCISAVLGPICMKLGECIQVDSRLRFMGPTGSKVIEVKGQIYVVFFCWSCFFSVCSPTSLRSLGRSSPNLVARLRAAPDISSRGSFFKGQGHRGHRSNFCISAVLGPICMKLGECIHVDP